MTMRMPRHPRVHSDKELNVVLSSSEAKYALSAFEPGSEIIDSEYFDNYNLPAPVRIRVRRRNGEVDEVVLRKARHGSVKAEARAFGILRDVGFSVPRVLLQPTIINDQFVMLTSLLNGVNLQKLSMSSETQSSHKALNWSGKPEG